MYTRTFSVAHAYAVNPIGPVPYSGYQVFGLFLVCFGPIPAVVACILRWYARRISCGLGLDDWLIFLATAIGIPQSVFTVFYVRTGYWGIHDRDIPPHPWNQGFFWDFMNRLCYTPLLVLVKISALLFLLRLGGTKRLVRLSCKALIALLVGQLAVFLPANILMCYPVQFAWLGPAAGTKGKCFQADMFFLSLAVINVVTDILTLLVPFMAFLGIKLNERVRFAILAVFALGGLVTFASTLRLYSVIRIWFLQPADRHYSLGYTLYTIEVNLAIITATLPTLWPLCRRWFPGVFEAMGLHRPYLVPDIEVGYASRINDDESSKFATVGTTTATAAAAVEVEELRPPLKAKTLWLSRPRPLSFLRPLSVSSVAATAPVDVGGGQRGVGRNTNTTTTSSSSPEQSPLAISGTAPGQEEKGELSESGDEDVIDYHGMVRRVEMDIPIASPSPKQEASEGDGRRRGGGSGGGEG